MVLNCVGGLLRGKGGGVSTDSSARTFSGPNRSRDRRVAENDAAAF
jgi:hypothetical protein